MEETLNRMEEIEKAVFFIFCGIRIFPHTRLSALAREEGQIIPDQERRAGFLSIEKYRNGSDHRPGQKQARGRMNWVYGDGGRRAARVVTRMHAHGHSGPLWELLLR